MSRASHLSHQPSIWVFSALVALGPFSIDAYLPAMQKIALSLNSDLVTLAYTVSAYLLGSSLGQFVGGPLSDKRGRKIVAMTGLSIFTLASISIAFVQIDWIMIPLRALQGLGGGFATVICLAVMRDLYDPIEAARKHATVIFIMMMAPLIAPSVGSLISQYNWRGIFLFLASYSIIVLVYYGLRIPETLRYEKQKFTLRGMLSQYAVVVKLKVEGHRYPVRIPVAMALASSNLMIFLVNASFMFLEYYQFSQREFVLLFFTLVGFYSIGNRIAHYLLPRVNPAMIIRVGYSLLVLALFTAAVLLMMSYDNLLLIAPLIVVSVGIMGASNPGGSAVFLQFYDRSSGSASSIITALGTSVGAGMGALANWLNNGTLLPPVIVMVICSVVALLLVLSVPLKLNWDEKNAV